MLWPTNVSIVFWGQIYIVVVVVYSIRVKIREASRPKRTTHCNQPIMRCPHLPRPSPWLETFVWLLEAKSKEEIFERIYIKKRKTLCRGEKWESVYYEGKEKWVGGVGKKCKTQTNSDRSLQEEEVASQTKQDLDQVLWAK